MDCEVGFQEEKLLSTRFSKSLSDVQSVFRLTVDGNSPLSSKMTDFCKADSPTARPDLVDVIGCAPKN